MAYSFMPTGLEGGSSWVSDLLGLGSGIAGIVQSYTQPTVQQPSTGIFNIPGVDIQSPIVSEATVAQRTACERLQAPFRAPTTAMSARPQMFVVPNPATGKATFFAPVKITGVRAYGTGNMVTRRKRCACRGKR